MNAQEGFTILEKVTERLLKRFGEQYLTQHKRVAIASVDSSDTVNRYFGAALRRYLNGRGIRSPSRDAGVDHLRLRFDVLDWNVDLAFDKVSRKVVREGTLTLFFELAHHPSDETIWRGRFEEAYSDSIAVEQLSLLAVKPEKSNRRSIWQPILITGVTGVVVYLFYALRSR